MLLTTYISHCYAVKKKKRINKIQYVMLSTTSQLNMF